jgi:hypothetical protein
MGFQNELGDQVHVPSAQLRMRAKSMRILYIYIYIYIYIHIYIYIYIYFYTIYTDILYIYIYISYRHISECYLKLALRVVAQGLECTFQMRSWVSHARHRVLVLMLHELGPQHTEKMSSSMEHVLAKSNHREQCLSGISHGAKC